MSQMTFSIPLAASAPDPFYAYRVVVVSALLAYFWPALMQEVMDFVMVVVLLGNLAWLVFLAVHDQVEV